MDFPHLLFIRFFNVQTYLYIGIYAIYDKKLFDKNMAAKQLQVLYYTPYSLTLLGSGLVMRNQNTQTNMKLIINKDVEYVICVFAVYVNIWMRAHSISRPLDDQPAL